MGGCHGAEDSAQTERDENGELEPELPLDGSSCGDDLSHLKAKVCDEAGHMCRAHDEPAEAAGECILKAAGERWIEVDYGEYDGRPLADVPLDVWAAWRTDPGFVPPGGESMHAMDQRVRAAAADALEAARDRTVVVVSHVSPIKAAISWALGGDISMSWRCHLDQAAVCRIAPGPAGPVVRSFNEVLYVR